MVGLRHASGRFALAGLVGVMGCSVAAGRFPLREPLWRDDDRQAFSPEPDEYISPKVWDVGDQSIFYPLTRFFAVDPAGESINVNALDEVPDSGWFENRMSRGTMSPDEVALGPCGDAVGAPTPWTVAGAKPNGANPGFVIRDANGQRHLAKFDGVVQGPRATAADVIVSKLYHAAGYHVPCNRIVSFDPERDVTIEEGATGESATGEEEPLTEAHLAAVYAKAYVNQDGTLRASTSRFLDGKPIGPFRYQGVRGDDPNDVIPHQDRRELRGMRLLAAWTLHFDAREQNTLATWQEVGEGTGYVRHNVIDFGDCFGSVWEPPSLGRRVGNSYYLDLQLSLIDWLTFGWMERPWDGARFGPSGKVFGYFDVEHFDPEGWRSGYPNPAFSRMSERDGAWMARIVASFSENHLRAAVAAGSLRDERLEQELMRILLGRREKLLERYLTRLSPLTDPHQRTGAARQLCMRDVVVTSGLRPQVPRRYAVVEHGGNPGPAGPIRRAVGSRACVDLTPVAGASASSPAYRVVDWVSQSEGHPAEYPARVHLYDLGAGGLKVAGLERPESFDPPD